MRSLPGGAALSRARGIGNGARAGRASTLSAGNSVGALQECPAGGSCVPTLTPGEGQSPPCSKDLLIPGIATALPLHGDTACDPAVTKEGSGPLQGPRGRSGMGFPRGKHPSASPSPSAGTFSVSTSIPRGLAERFPVSLWNEGEAQPDFPAPFAPGWGSGQVGTARWAQPGEHSQVSSPTRTSQPGTTTPNHSRSSSPSGMLHAGSPGCGAAAPFPL